MQFCPSCASLLLVGGSRDGYRFYCHSCPYVHAIRRPIIDRVYLKRKEVDDVLGGADAWKNVDQTEGKHGSANETCKECIMHMCVCVCMRCTIADVGGEHTGMDSDNALMHLSLCVLLCFHLSLSSAVCPKCAHNRAFFMQIQTRSADEPMTTFYKCANFSCGARWKEG